MSDDDKLPTGRCLQILMALVIICWGLVAAIVWGLIAIWPN